MKKKWMWLLLVLPLAVVVGAIAPGTDGWRAPCACIKAKDTFVHLARVRGDLWEPQAAEKVAAGMVEQYPKGTPVHDLHEQFTRPFMNSASCQARAGSYSCQFWLEENGAEERGYEVVFGLTPDGTATTGVATARIIHATNRKKS